MRPSMVLRALAALPAIAPLSTAQHVCEGNGLAPLSIAISPAYLGGALEVDLAAPTAPGGVVLLAKSTAVGPVFHPLIGWSCLDVFAPGLKLFPLGLDGAGAVHLSLALPPEVALVGAPPIFLSPALPTPLGIALGKTVPVHPTFPNSWAPAGKLPAPRAFLRATALGDGPGDDRIDVFLSGGGDLSIVEPGSKRETWIYHPLTRSFEPGPLMSAARNFHTQTKLADGRVLILGGCNAQGVCHASGEIYDHDTGLLTPTAPMAARRAGHAATLLDDGRVLVTGGLADYQNAKTAFKAALDTAQDTAEIYDPASDAWTQVATPMGSKRSGHGQVRWHDGRVLVLMGIEGGMLLSGGWETADFTGACDWFDPLSGTFQPAPGESLPSHHVGRAFFGTSFLGSGDLLVAGGVEKAFYDFSGAKATGRISRFNGSSWTEHGATSSLALPYPGDAALPAQATLPDGRALIVGGFGELEFLSGVDQVIATDTLDCDFWSTCGESLAPLGTGVGQPGLPSPRGGHAMVRLFDGTFLVVGGMNGSETTPIGTWALDDASIYAP